MSSAMPLICIAPSPTKHSAGRDGCANFAAMAYGIAAPIEASPPEWALCMPDLSFRSRENQWTVEPVSHASIAPSGSRGESSQKTRRGLIGFASAIARFPSMRHQSATLFSTFWRHDRTVLVSTIRSSARSVVALSPTRLTSIG
jgi:hypothetical protein